MAFDFIVMLIFLGDAHGNWESAGEVWCLNLLDNQWLKCEKRMPGVSLSYQFINTAENELHVWYHGHNEKKHFKLPLLQLLPKHLARSFRAIVHGYVGRELPVELLDLIQRFWFTLG